MRFWKSFFFIFLCTFFFTLCSGVTKAAEEFSIDAAVTYDVSNSGKTTVIHNITLENNFSTLMAKSYSLGLENIDAQSVYAEDSFGNSLPVDVQKNGSLTNLKILFPDAVTGKGAKRNFSIVYENSVFAVRTGEIWEVAIPRIEAESNFRNYSLVLKIPVDYGLEAYISPKPESSEVIDQKYIYKFAKNDISQTGITAGFGQFQVFSYNLSYHLENPLSKNTKTQIALPPDTAFQKVYIQKIEPAPANVTVDADGNWLATYNLTPRQRIDVAVSGSVQIFSSHRPFTKSTDKSLTDNLKETEYWQISNPQIKDLAGELKTPKSIYNYVSGVLKYDFSRVQPNVQRMGAISALQNPTQAICMEFTDLFIALARAAGIPAREINGFAYTENPDLQPLSLVSDVLHSWPEYYDREKNAWIPIDPTWAATTGGVDFFDKLDLRHFAFVIHGENSVTPYPPGSYKLGPNPQKDVYVSFGKLPADRADNVKITLTPYRTLPFFSSIYEAKISNNGSTALYSVSPTIYYDSKEVSRDSIEVLPPYANVTLKIEVPFSLLGKNTPNIIEMKIGSSNAKITTNKNQIVIASLLVISVFLVISILIIMIRRKKNNIFSFFVKIGAWLKKTYERSTKKSSQDTSNT